MREGFALRARGRAGELPTLPQVLPALDRLALQLAAVTGAQTDRMTRDHGWRLLTVGRLLERLIGLAARLEALPARPGALAQRRRHRTAARAVRQRHHLPRPLPAPRGPAGAGRPAGAGQRQPARLRRRAAPAAHRTAQAARRRAPRIAPLLARLPRRRRRAARWRRCAAPSDGAIAAQLLALSVRWRERRDGAGRRRRRALSSPLAHGGQRCQDWLARGAWSTLGRRPHETPLRRTRARGVGLAHHLAPPAAAATTSADAAALLALATCAHRRRRAGAAAATARSTPCGNAQRHCHACIARRTSALRVRATQPRARAAALRRRCDAGAVAALGCAAPSACATWPRAPFRAGGRVRACRRPTCRGWTRCATTAAPRFAAGPAGGRGGARADAPHPRRLRLRDATAPRSTRRWRVVLRAARAACARTSRT
ncbi:MAG: alpha-E domain-containing protein [Comamonadaceae bacterium]|nr:alpha-E domain-containing protein [Comamonadaceae bacterium]